VNSKNKWEADYEQEIERASLARMEGNEGMARVCARRAAGIVIGEYLRRCGYSGVNTSMYDRISLFLELPHVDERAREVSRHFLMKVNPEHKLPVNTDLIQDATWLKKSLLKED